MSICEKGYRPDRTMITALKNLFPRAPSKDLIKEYRAKVGFLQKVVDDAKATSEDGKKRDDSDLPDSVHYRLTDSQRRSAALAQATVSSAGPFRPPPGQSDSDPMAAEIHLRLRERRNISEREMLLGSNDSGVQDKLLNSVPVPEIWGIASLQ